MKIKNETQHKMKCLTGMIHSYQSINIKTINNRSRESGLRTTCYQLIILILLSITIGSCYSIESDCDDVSIIPILPEDGFFEYTGGPLGTTSIEIASNGDIWVSALSGVIPFYSNKILLSTDNGDTWIEKGSIEWQTMSIAINPINDYIFVGTFRNGLFRSTDRGENWVKVTDDMEVHDILITASGEIYFGSTKFVGEKGRLYYSNNNCDTWVEKSNGLLAGDNVSIGSFAIGTDGTLYVGTIQARDFSYHGVYRSTDGGDTWLPSSNYTNTIVPNFAISDDGSIFAIAWSYGVLKSIDRGVTWNLYNNFGYHDMYRIIYNPITKDIFVGGNEWIYRSTDLGTSWKLANNGIGDDQLISSFAFNPNTGQMYVTTGNGVYRSRNYPEQQKK